MLGNWPEGLGEQDSVSYFFFTISTIVTFIVLANMLIQIVSDIYGEVAEKKYLYVYRERVELICDLHVFSKVASWSKRLFFYFINRGFWLMTKMMTGKGRNSAIGYKEKTYDMV